MISIPLGQCGREALQSYAPLFSEVGEGFLDDPVGSQVGGGGECYLRSGRFEGDVEPDGLGEGDQFA